MSKGVRHLIALAMITTVLGTATGSAQAQVINSGPSTTNSNSKVTLSASIPSIVLVNVDQGLSVLNMSVDPNLIGSSKNVVSSDFTVKGAVVANNTNAQVQCSVSTLKLILTNNRDTITANLKGTIGGVPISTSGFSPIFSSRKADISITGDLDESTVTLEKQPGNYSGTLTITASLL